MSARDTAARLTQAALHVECAATAESKPARASELDHALRQVELAREELGAMRAACEEEESHG